MSQARLQSEAEAAAAAEERLGRVLAAMDRCQAFSSDLDALADAYSDLQASRAASGDRDQGVDDEVYALEKGLHLQRVWGVMWAVSGYCYSDELRTSCAVVICVVLMLK